MITKKPMEKREGYKQTSLGWIPEEWEVKKFEDVANKITDGTHITPNYIKKGIPFLRVTDIKNSKIDLKTIKYISEEEHKRLIERCKPEKGDILYSKNGSIGIAKFIDWDWEFSIFVSLALIKINNKVSWNHYIKYLLSSRQIFKQINLRSKKGTVTNLHLEEIRKFDILLPPLPEQKKIAAILSTVDEKIESIETEIDAAQQLKKGLMQQLLTRGIGHTEFKETPIGKIPKKWEVVKLINLSVSGIKNGAFNDPKRVGKGYKLINVVNLYSEPYIKTDNLELLDLDKNEFIKYEVKKEDIFFTRSSLKLEGIAHCNINLSEEKDLIYECHIMRLRSDKTKVNPYYLRYYCISYPARKYFMSHAKQVTMTTISQSDIASMPIPLPPIHEQKKIAEILGSMDEKLDILREKKEAYQALKKGLMQQLLTGKMRVSTSPAA